MIFSILLQHHIKNLPGIYNLLSEVPKFQHHKKLSSKCNSLLVKRVFFLLNAVFAVAILDLISRVRLTLFVVMLHKKVKIFHIIRCFIDRNLYRG
jgi:hypothetical protein